MPGYYAYIVDSDGHIKNRVDIKCDDDEEARRLAEQVADVEGRAVELWHLASKIARIEPSS
jgi:hypothetical protein